MHVIASICGISFPRMSSDLLCLATHPRLSLAAVHPSRNIRREYLVERQQDLFDWHQVSWSWGRIGHRPCSRVRSFDNETEAIAFVRTLLRRRSTAPKRIGVAYRVRSEGREGH